MAGAGVPSAHGNRAAAALAFATVTVYSDIYITQPILPLLSREYGIRPAAAGMSVSAVVLMIALVSIPWGTLSDAVGRKPVMVWSLFLLAVPTLLCAAAASFTALLWLRALQGMLIPGVTAVAVAYLGDHFQAAELSPRVGGWIAASVAGGLLGRVAGGLLAAWFHWRVSFVVFGLLTVAGAAALARFLPAAATAAGDRANRLAFSPGELLRHFRNRRLVGAFLIGAAVFFGFIGIFTYLPYYLTSPPFHLSTAAVSSVYLVYVAGIFTSIVSSRLSAGRPGWSVMAVGLATAACGAVGTLVRSVPSVLASLVVLCVGMFVVQSTAPAFVNANAKSARGAAGALYVTFYYVGATFGSALPGYAWQSWGWPGVVASCVAAFSIGMAVDVALCR